MALQLKYFDEHGVLQIDMSPSSSPRDDPADIRDPQFDTINRRFGQCDLFGGKYDCDTPSLFRSRYNSIEEELANTPYAFATDRSLRRDQRNDSVVDVTIDSRYDAVDTVDIEYGLFGPQVDSVSRSSVTSEETPAFTVTQLIHAQDRYFDLSQKSKSDVRSGVVKSLASSFEVRSVPGSAKRTARVADAGSSGGREAFKVLNEATPAPVAAVKLPVVATPKKKKETSFAIIAEAPISRPSSPRSLPVEIRPGRVSPFKGRGFREETSRHNTPKTSAANSRCSSPPRRRTNSLSKIDKMTTMATLPPPVHLIRPHSPRNFLKENIEEIRELSELNREKHEAEAEQKRREEEEALLKEMGLLDKTDSKSRVNSRTNSRSNSPIKIKIKSRSSSPSAVLYYENIEANSNDFVNADAISSTPVAHRSRLRSVSRSQPQSNNGSPKNSKIPQRQASVSPVRNSRYDIFTHRRPVENNLNKNPRFISNSTSSIHETIKIGSKIHDRRDISKSSQHLDISPAIIRSKPPISPSRAGPPPSNKSINAKRLSPIVGTPNKTPIDNTKQGAGKISSKPTPAPRRPAKTANTPTATSRTNSRTPTTASREPSPDKRKNITKTSPPKPVSNTTRPVSRVASSKTAQKPTPIANKAEVKKPMNRTNSTKSLTRTPSTKTLNEKPPILKKKDSKKDLMEKTKSTGKVNEIGIKNSKEEKSMKKGNVSEKDTTKAEENKTDIAIDTDEVTTQDNETQYDKGTNENGELVILTKKNIVSMTTAAITSQPLEVVATVTNQLPSTFEKAREKGIFERLSSKDSLVVKIEETEIPKDNTDQKEIVDKLEKDDKKPPPKPPKSTDRASVFTDDNIKLRLLQPPYNNPQVERVKQKIDDILKEPEISTENILLLTPKAKQHIKETVEEVKTKATEKINDEVQNVVNVKEDTIKKSEEITAEIRSEASKIVDSIITPVEEPKEIVEKAKIEVKETIEPIVMVVNERKNGASADIAEKMSEALVKGEAEVEVQSSNLSTPGGDKLTVPVKMTDGTESDKSAQSNGGFPQSTSTTPKPPARANRQPKEDKTQSSSTQEAQPEESEKKQSKPNLCQRLMGKCKAKCCTCCVKQEEAVEKTEERSKTEETQGQQIEHPAGEKKSAWKNLNCFKKKDVDVEDIERAAGKTTTIEFESETQRKRKRKLRDVLCACCRRQRVADVSEPPRRVVSPPVTSSDAITQGGCCGKKREAERRDSILSDQTGNACCNNRLCRWLRGACRRQSEQSSSRRTSLFSKNKSLSPTLPPEDTRTKLDSSLVEHTSVMRGAIPVLPIALAYLCLVCNVLVPGLGTIFSGMFCLCFGIPRFGVHDGARHRIGALLIDVAVGCGQLFTVLFCLVGWGWSIWWGVIMLKIARKYRKLKAEAMAEEAEAPPITANNHTRA